MPDGHAEFAGFGILQGIGGGADLVAAMTVARVSSDVGTNLDAIVSSVDHIGITTHYGQNIIHGNETLNRCGDVLENVRNCSSASYRGEVDETYESDVSDTVQGLAVKIGGKFRLKVHGIRKERVFGSLCYIQRSMRSSLCLGSRVVTCAGASASASTVRIKSYVGARALAYASAVITNGLFHLEQYYNVQSQVGMKVEKIRLVLRNVGVLATSAAPPPMQGQPLPPLPSRPLPLLPFEAPPAYSETAGFADESVPADVIS